MTPDQLHFYQRNLRALYASEIARGLIFIVPVWVAFELQYLTFSQLTIIEAVIYATQMILELPTGAFADLLGKKASNVLGSLIKTIAWFLFAFSTSFPMFLLYALLLGLGEALVSGAREALLYDTMKQVGKEDEFDKVQGKLNVVFQLTLALATVIGGFLAQWYFLLPMLGYAAANLVATILSLGMQEPSIDSEVFTWKSYVKQTKLGFLELLKTSYSRQISAFYVLVGVITWVMVMAFKNLLLTDLGYTDIELGVSTGLLRIFNSLVLFKLLNIGKLFTKERAFLFFPILLIISFLPGLWFTKWWALPFVAGGMLGSSARWVVLSKYTNEVFDSRRRATAISALSMCIGVIYVGIMLISGPIMEHWGGPKMIFTLLGVLAAVTVLPLGFTLRAREKRLAAEKPA